MQIDPPEEGDDISLLHAFKMPGGDESAKGVMARDISLPGTKDVVQAYRINKEGKLLLLVTRDTMKLTHADTIPFLNLGSDTYSPETQTPSSGRRVSFSSAQTTDDVELTDVINNCFLEKVRVSNSPQPPRQFFMQPDLMVLFSSTWKTP